jgi:hypothetical protein
MGHLRSPPGCRRGPAEGRAAAPDLHGGRRWSEARVTRFLGTAFCIPPEAAQHPCTPPGDRSAVAAFQALASTFDLLRFSLPLPFVRRDPAKAQIAVQNNLAAALAPRGLPSPAARRFGQSKAWFTRSSRTTTMGRSAGEGGRLSNLDGQAPEGTDFANYFCTYAYLYHQARDHTGAGARREAWRVGRQQAAAGGTGAVAPQAPAAGARRLGRSSRGAPAAWNPAARDPRSASRPRGGGRRRATGRVPPLRQGRARA